MLAAVGCMKENETLEYRKAIPFSRSDYFEGLMQDDRVGVQLCDAKGWQTFQRRAQARDQEAFAASAKQYEKVVPDRNLKKVIRRQPVFTAWGGEVEGDTGWCGPPRSKLLGLIALTAEIATFRVCDPALLSSLLSSWAFFLQFKHCLFAFLFFCYREGPAPDSPEGLFRLSEAAANELLLLAWLAQCPL